MMRRILVAAAALTLAHSRSIGLRNPRSKQSSGAPSWTKHVNRQTVAIGLGIVQATWQTLRVRKDGAAPASTKPTSSSSFRVDPTSSSDVRFDDIGGQKEAVTALRDVADFVRDRERFAAVGAAPPKGVLLHGPPGCGKTLLAKALARESNATFFSASGSSFVEVYSGLGAKLCHPLCPVRGKRRGIVMFQFFQHLVIRVHRRLILVVCFRRGLPVLLGVLVERHPVLLANPFALIFDRLHILIPFRLVCAVEVFPLLQRRGLVFRPKREESKKSPKSQKSVDIVVESRTTLRGWAWMEMGVIYVS